MERPLAELVRLAGPKTFATVGVLTLLVAAGEGLGFVLLVPLLARLGAGGDAATPVDRALSAIGWDPGLAALLTIFVGIALGRALADYARGLVAFRAMVRVVDGLRARAFSALVEADWRALSGMRQSDNRALLITTIDRAAIAVDIFWTLLKTLLSLAAVGLAALALSPLVALAGAGAGLVVMLLYAGLRRRARTLGAALYERHRVIHARLEENLDALRLIKSYGMEDRARADVAEGFSAMRRVERQYVVDSGRARLVLQAGGALVLALLVWFAVARWGYQAAVLLPLVALFVRAVPQLGALQDSWQQWAHAAPALSAARTLVREAEAHAEPRMTDVDVPEPRRELALRGATLRHRGDRPALDGVDLAIAAGTTVALVGPSGAGKSTVADILGGLLSPDEGELAIDGQALDAARRRVWRHRVAYVQQEPVLFAGSVRDNLLWAKPDAGEARLEAVLRMASAEFVFDLPGSMDCELGERGRQLSGGERQRIVLARALLREPALLILDEATSALDPASDEAVAAAIARLSGTRIILVIGHRGALTAIADRRITLDRGRIVADVLNRGLNRGM